MNKAIDWVWILRYFHISRYWCWKPHQFPHFYELQFETFLFDFFLILEGDYSTARHHFVHCYEGEKYAKFLIEYHVMNGFPGEIDMFVALAVLQ